MGTSIQTVSASRIEQALIGGDLKSLSTEERLNYYKQVCESIGVNPLTKPFAYITLNGKLVLYALRDCTDQLRSIHKVSIVKVSPQQIGDLLVVVAEAKDGDGRTDSSTGAVSVKGLQGEAMANAMMKAETKAKRRVTLSLCGLGMLDETEVNTLREQGIAQTEPESAPQISATSHQSAPQILPKSQRSAPAVSNPNVITEKQRKMLFAIQRSVNFSDDDVKDEMGKLGLTCHRDEIPKNRFQAVLDAIDPEFGFHKRPEDAPGE